MNEKLRELVVALSSCPRAPELGSGDNPELWRLSAAWKAHVREWMRRREESWRQQNSIAAALGQYVETYFHRRITHFDKASRLYFVESMLDAAGTLAYRKIDTTKRLSEPEATYFARWLKGMHPQHSQRSDDEIEAEREKVYLALHEWLVDHEDEILVVQKDVRYNASVAPRREAYKQAVADDLLIRQDTTLPRGMYQYILIHPHSGTPICVSMGKHASQVRRKPGFENDEDGNYQMDSEMNAMLEVWQEDLSPLMAVAVVEEREDGTRYWAPYPGHLVWAEKSYLSQKGA